MKKETTTATRRRKTHTIHRCMRWIDGKWTDQRYGKTLAVIAPNLPKFVLDFSLQGNCKECVWSDDHADYIIHPCGDIQDGKHRSFEIDVTVYGMDDQWKIAWMHHVGGYEMKAAAHINV